MLKSLFEKTKRFLTTKLLYSVGETVFGKLQRNKINIFGDRISSPHLERNLDLFTRFPWGIFELMVGLILGNLPSIADRERNLSPWVGVCAMIRGGDRIFILIHGTPQKNPDYFWLVFTIDPE